MREEHFKELRRNITAELTEIKKTILQKMKHKLEEVLSPVSDEARKLPLLSLIEGLKRSYTGKTIMIRKNKRANNKRAPKSAKKRPSVMLQVEDQSFVFDGDGLKVVGSWDGKQYKGMLDEINGILKKHITKR
ncbi:transcription-repair-coupling factor [Encephalitozoon hellem]|uniref:Transcription-repair-coupling factor n=1 Tax=Encephalitozoon hellem TaxID=27973 RepID=A0ABY8CM28_ENCHE|nr:transcription-repair-coupling factor [Encephalitozoon hellem]